MGMSQAWILVNTVLGKEKEVLATLKNIPGVREAHIVTGQYDLMVLIEAQSMKQLSDILSWNIRRLKHIRNTITMIVT